MSRTDGTGPKGPCQMQMVEAFQTNSRKGKVEDKMCSRRPREGEAQILMFYPEDLVGPGHFSLTPAPSAALSRVWTFCMEHGCLQFAGVPLLQNYDTLHGNNPRSRWRDYTVVLTILSCVIMYQWSVGLHTIINMASYRSGSDQGESMQGNTHALDNVISRL